MTGRPGSVSTKRERRRAAGDRARRSLGCGGGDDPRIAAGVAGATPRRSAWCRGCRSCARSSRPSRATPASPAAISLSSVVEAAAGARARWRRARAHMSGKSKRRPARRAAAEVGADLRAPLVAGAGVVLAEDAAIGPGDASCRARRARCRRLAARGIIGTASMRSPSRSKRCIHHTRSSVPAGDAPSGLRQLRSGR